MKTSLEQCQTNFLHSIIDPSVDIASVTSTLQTPAHLDAEQALMIYRQAYFARLLECLNEDFPVLRHYLGDDLFQHFAMEYIAKKPPSSYTLFELGQGFPEYLRQTIPDTSAMPTQQQRMFYAPIEIASLERQHLNLSRSPDQLERLSFEPDYNDQSRLLETEISIPENLILIESQFDLVEYFSKFKSGDRDIELRQEQTFILCAKRRFHITLHKLSSWQFQFLDSAHCSGTEEGGFTSLNDVCTQMELRHGISKTYLYGCLPLWLPIALAHGYMKCREARR